jgi:hypothetical protein
MGACHSVSPRRQRPYASAGLGAETLPTPPPPPAATAPPPPAPEAAEPALPLAEPSKSAPAPQATRPALPVRTMSTPTMRGDGRITHTPERGGRRQGSRAFAELDTSLPHGSPCRSPPRSRTATPGKLQHGAEFGSASRWSAHRKTPTRAGDNALITELDVSSNLSAGDEPATTDGAPHGAGTDIDLSRFEDHDVFHEIDEDEDAMALWSERCTYVENARREISHLREYAAAVRDQRYADDDTGHKTRVQVRRSLLFHCARGIACRPDAVPRCASRRSRFTRQCKPSRSC